MDLEEIQISEGGRATFWYGDSGLLLGRSIRVAFTPAETGEALDAAARPED